MTTRQRSTSSSTDPPNRSEVVLGVDTHGEVHVAAVVSPLGLGTESFPATAVGYRQLLVWGPQAGDGAPGRRGGHLSDASSDTQPARCSTWSDRFPAPPRYRGVRET
jgi:hypothetical protein